MAKIIKTVDIKNEIEKISSIVCSY